MEFYPNIRISDLVELIGSSKIFVHTMRYEDFGLTTCESIAGGCVPCVIDSGGQRETVPFRSLRFRSLEEPTRIVDRINNTNDSELSGLKRGLFQHTGTFDEKNFKEQMLKVIFGDNS